MDKYASAGLGVADVFSEMDQDFFVGEFGCVAIYPQTHDKGLDS